MNTEDFIKECIIQVEKRKAQKWDLFRQFRTATENERFWIERKITKLLHEISAIENAVNELNRK